MEDQTYLNGDIIHLKDGRRLIIEEHQYDPEFGPDGIYGGDIYAVGEGWAEEKDIWMTAQDVRRLKKEA